MKKESTVAKRQRAAEIVRLLEIAYPAAAIALESETPFQLLIATILSAQCTDVRVNMVTPALFARYPGPKDVVDAPIEEIEKMIFSTGFYRNKAKSIKNACTALIEEFGGEVPGTMDELLKLPGVGRKTANVLLGTCFGVPGVVVDTHVKRISNLLGLVSSQDPDKIEGQLGKVVAADKQINFGHLLATHGRAVCVARRPKCDVCPLAPLCPSVQFPGALPQAGMGRGVAP